MSGASEPLYSSDKLRPADVKHYHCLDLALPRVPKLSPDRSPTLPLALTNKVHALALGVMTEVKGMYHLPEARGKEIRVEKITLCGRI